MWSIRWLRTRHPSVDQDPSFAEVPARLGSAGWTDGRASAAAAAATLRAGVYGSAAAQRSAQPPRERTLRTPRFPAEGHGFRLPAGVTRLLMSRGSPRTCMLHPPPPPALSGDLVTRVRAAPQADCLTWPRHRGRTPVPKRAPSRTVPTTRAVPSGCRSVRGRRGRAQPRRGARTGWRAVGARPVLPGAVAAPPPPPQTAAAPALPRARHSLHRKRGGERGVWKHQGEPGNPPKPLRTTPGPAGWAAAPAPSSVHHAVTCASPDSVPKTANAVGAGLSHPKWRVAAARSSGGRGQRVRGGRPLAEPSGPFVSRVPLPSPCRPGQ